MALALVLLFLLSTTPANAHGLNASFAEITVAPTRIEHVYLLSVEDVVAHFPVEIDGTGRVSPAALDRVMPDVLAFLRTHLTLTVDQDSSGMPGSSCADHGGGAFILCTFSRSLESSPAQVSVRADPAFFERIGPQHTIFVKVTVDGRTDESVVTLDHATALFATGYRPALARCLAAVTHGFARMFVRYEHAAFVFALLIVAASVRELVEAAVAFALAHTLTLVLAMLEMVTLPPRVVEASIALTVACVAFDNFFTTTGRYRWLLSLWLGLLHGLGFANGLRGTELAGRELLPALLSYNIGLQLALAAIVAVVFLITRALTTCSYRHIAVAAASGVIFVFGVASFLHGAFGFSITRI